MRLDVPLRPEIVAAFAVALLALWGAVAWTLYHARAQAIEGAAGARRSLARSLAEYQDASVRTIDLALRTLREEWDRDLTRFDDAVARQEEYLRKEKVIQVAALDREGRVVYSRLPTQAPASFADRDYFKVQKSRGTDELHISEPVLGRVTGQWAIQFTRPLRDAGGRFAGLIVVAVPPPALEDIYRDLGLGMSGVITLVRDDGLILARTGGLGQARRLSLPDSGGDYRMVSPIDGVDRFYSYSKLRSYPLTVFVGESASEVLAPYYLQLRTMLAGGALATLMLAALFALAASRARDRRRFHEAQERIALDLHDSSIQSIYTVGLQLEYCRRLVEKDPPAAARVLTEAQANLGVVIQDLRALIAGEAAQAPGEQAFLEDLRRAIPAPDAGAPAFSLEIDSAALGALSGEQAMHVQRIAREAVSNIVRHAGARNARLSLALAGAQVRLEASDDGTGIAGSGGDAGLGLQHIQARARKLGGRATIASGAGGTRIRVEFPRG